MKKLTLLVVTLIVLSILVMGNPKVGFIATNFSSEAQATVANEFEKLAGENGWELVLLNSAGSIEKQSTQLENLVQMGVDVVVMAMSHPNEIRSSLDYAIESEIPVITIDSGYVDGVVCDITADNFVMGAKISTYLLDSLSGNGNIIVVKFEKHQGARRRGKILDVVLSEYPGINVLAEYNVAATARYMDDTRSAVETYALKYGDEIDGVWCAFDQLAYAAADVLSEYGINNAMIVSVDGSEETYRRIKSGQMTATVAQPFDQMADKAIEIIEKIIAGIDPKEAAGKNIIYVDAPLVDKTNLPE
ncbi:MAG: ribose transport system substrate-binding protein [Kosmotogales bacterium]|nr:ribose transport system substrate-binding protein [Kosmotogales bacterium]